MWYAKDWTESYRIQIALKASLAAGICVFCLFAFHLPLEFGFFSVVSAFVLISMFDQQIFSKAAERVLGPFAGVAMALLICSLFVNTSFLFFSSLMVLLIFLFYLSHLKIFSYAMLFSGVITAVLLLLTIQTPHNVVNTSAELLFQVTLGSFVAISIKAIWPDKTEAYLLQAMHDFLLLSNRQSECDDTYQAKESMLPIQTMHKKVAQFMAFNKALPSSRTNRQVLYAKIIHLTKRIDLCQRVINKMLSKIDDKTLFDHFDTSILAHLKQLNQLNRDAADFLLNPKEYDFDTQNAIENIAQTNQQLAQMRNSGQLQHYSANNLRALIVLLDKIDRNLHLLNSIRFLLRKRNQLKRLKPERSKSFKQVLFNKIYYNEEAMKNAIKTTLPVLMVIIATTYFHWPAGTQAVIAAVVISFQENLGLSSQRTEQRALGIILGFIIVLLFAAILSAVGHVLMLILLISLSCFVFSYMTTGDSKISYLGLQAGILVPLVLLSTNGNLGSQTFDIAIRRFFGVFEGAFFGWLCLMFLWPKDTMKHLRYLISQSLQGCYDVYTHIMRFSEHPDFSPKKLLALHQDTESIATQHDALLEDIRFQFFKDDETIDQYQELAEQIDLLHIQLFRLLYFANKNTNQPTLALYQATYEYRKAVAQNFRRLLSNFNMQTLDSTTGKHFTHLQQQLNSIIEDLRKQQNTTSLNFSELRNYINVVSVMQSIIQTLKDISDAVHIINSPKPSVLAEPEPNPT